MENVFSLFRTRNQIETKEQIHGIIRYKSMQEARPRCAQ